MQTEEYHNLTEQQSFSFLSRSLELLHINEPEEELSSEHRRFRHLFLYCIETFAHEPFQAETSDDLSLIIEGIIFNEEFLELRKRLVSESLELVRSEIELRESSSSEHSRLFDELRSAVGSSFKAKADRFEQLLELQIDLIAQILRRFDHEEAEVTADSQSVLKLLRDHSVPIALRNMVKSGLRTDVGSLVVMALVVEPEKFKALVPESFCGWMLDYLNHHLERVVSFQAAMLKYKLPQEMGIEPLDEEAFVADVENRVRFEASRHMYNIGSDGTAHIPEEYLGDFLERGQDWIDTLD